MRWNSLPWSAAAFLAVGAFACATTSFAAAADRLNVVLIMADDLSCELGCYGSPLLKSPHIDRLAARGLRFDRAYCQYPVCNPSRVSMLSGRRPQTTRVVDNITHTRSALGDTLLLPEYFRKQGYTTIKVGKIFHTGEGFEDPRSWDVEFTETSEAKSPPKNQIAYEGWGRVVMLDAADEATWDGRLARQAIKQLDQVAAKSEPFFLAVGFRRPHAPYIAPRKYFEMYPAKSIPPLMEPADHVEKIPRIARPYLYYNEERLDAGHRAEVAAAYYASVTFMDTQLGLLLDSLERLGLWEKTVVVFASDHGYQLGEHGGLWHKMTLFEECCRVPLVVAAPERARGKMSSALVGLIDLYPTLIELCGLPPNDGLEGTSLAPLLSDPARQWKPTVTTVVSRVENRPVGQPLDPDRLGRSVRTQRWRYTEWPDGSRELYDQSDDPHEYQNLADSAEHAAVVDEHQKLLNKP